MGKMKYPVTIKAIVSFETEDVANCWTHITERLERDGGIKVFKPLISEGTFVIKVEGVK